jgi:hypothetical protein
VYRLCTNVCTDCVQILYNPFRLCTNLCSGCVQICVQIVYRMCTNLCTNLCTGCVHICVQIVYKPVCRLCTDCVQISVQVVYISVYRLRTNHVLICVQVVYKPVYWLCTNLFTNLYTLLCTDRVLTFLYTSCTKRKPVHIVVYRSCTNVFVHILYKACTHTFLHAFPDFWGFLAWLCTAHEVGTQVGTGSNPGQIPCLLLY